MKKLIQILNGQAYVPQQRWGLYRILATLVAHRNKPRLLAAYCQFKRLSYRTILIETNKLSGRWPRALTRRDVTLIIKL